MDFESLFMMIAPFIVLIILLSEIIKSKLKKRKANVLWHIGKECEIDGNKKSARGFYIQAIKNNPFRVKLLASLGRVLV